MPRLIERILALLQSEAGLTDRELTDRLFTSETPQTAVNSRCHLLERKGFIVRNSRPDGLIGNYLRHSAPPVLPLPSAAVVEDVLSEEAVKKAVDKYLRNQGWTTTVVDLKAHGVDIEAKRAEKRWLIEVKGRGTRPQMRVNYFLAMFGELLQRMNDEQARYSIAVPDLPQFRRLWERLPKVAKERTKITALFVDEKGAVTEP